MGCFLDCFGGGGKNRRRQNRRESSDQPTANKISVESAKPDHLNDRVPTVEEIPIPITEICEEIEEKCSPSPTRKRVTFDSRVQTYEQIVLQESVELLEEKQEEVKCSPSPTRKRVTFDSKVQTYELEESVELLEEVKSEERSLKSSSENIDAVRSNSSGLYPSNHRYNNCRESDDDEDEEEDELDDDGEDEEYFSDDGFSEDKLHNEVYTEEIGDNGLEIEEIDAKPRGVLNPVENLAQWKSAKSKESTIRKQSEKENSILIPDQEETTDSRVKLKKPKNQELTVETSLSTWLSTSETTSECNSVNMETPTPEKRKSSYYSKCSHDDRPILGALTLEEIKQFSANSTPRKSPSKSPDETPIIGTVGGYWGSNNDLKAKDCGSASSFKGIPNTTSKYREDKSVNWHSTPFEARLEKALKQQI